MQPTVRPPKQRLLVFARLPERGAVKTRLAATVGDDRALAIYEAMLRDVMTGVGTSDANTEIEVLWAPTPSANGDKLRRAFAPHAVALQTGADLGDRLAVAFSERFFFHRAQKIVAIGVDEPTLTRELIDHAFALLDSCEWVVGPAADGGYYLIGCRALSFDSEIFRNIEWGTASVLRDTLRKIADAKATIALLPERSDIDNEADLRRFAASGAEGELARLLKE